MKLFLRGLIIGFSIAAPVGPIGILCIQRTLLKGRSSGFVSGLGAATADAAYGCVAGFGLMMVSNFLTQQQAALQLVGGLFLCYLGVKVFFRNITIEPASANSVNLLSDYTSTFFLTLTNPATIISFTIIFAGLGLVGARQDPLSAASLVAGVFLGSAFWWLLLSHTTGRLRKKIDATWLQRINRASGIILIAFGLLALLTWMK